MWQVRKVIEKLRHTQQNICTNLALDVPYLAEYCERVYPSEPIRVAERVRILNTEETKTFWKHRGPARYRPDLMGGGNDVEYDLGEKGTCFIIDEAGAAGFNAQGWAQGEARTTRGVECCWYLDQQRKFGDDVIASANGRTANAIAKGFRDKAHEFVKLRNGYQRQMGIFKAQGKFTALHYSTEPGPNSEEFLKEDFHLDVTGLARCYRTQDGVGVSGSTADIGRRAKGIPVMWVFPGAIALGGLCIALPWLAGKGLGGLFGPKASKTPPGVVVPVVAPAASGGGLLRASALTPTGHPVGPVLAADVWVDGYAFDSSGPIVWMSDGSIYTGAELRQVSRAGVVLVDGRRFGFRPPRRPTEDRTPAAPTGAVASAR